MAALIVIFGTLALLVALLVLVAVQGGTAKVLMPSRRQADPFEYLDDPLDPASPVYIGRD